MKNKYWWMVGASAVGLVASFIQLLEKLTLLKNHGAVLSCNLNSVFSCSNVLNAHQSSVFGFPNPIIGLVMFTFFLTFGIFALTKTNIARRLALSAQGLALFMLGFTLWLFYENTYATQAVCIFCLFNGTAVLIINAALDRHNLANHRWFKKYYKNGADLFFWALIWLVVAFTMVLKFA